MPAESTTHWVFGYGSLIWRPGFPHIRQVPALLNGAHRSLCIYSHRHRGTEAQPGLVFGLVRGGSCRGMGFEVEDGVWPEVVDYLRERELDKGVYRETLRPVRVDEVGTVDALAFLVDEKHAQYAGRLAIAEQARLVRAGRGESGPNTEYVLETARILRSMGIRDRYLDELVEALGGVDVPVVRSA
ncbi:MAG TPA: gamma-glutamylcyclotransferase [Devosia sp.]